RNLYLCISSKKFAYNQGKGFIYIKLLGKTIILVL
ncbi:MAG: hypothetical protein ACI9AT_001727, partial [Ulvibacter sp.]